MTTPSTAPIRILLVDDHIIVRAGLRMLVESQPNFAVIGEAASGGEALQLAACERPDIILLDLNLRDGCGIDMLRDLLAAAPETRVIVLTGVPDPEEHRQAVRLGAMGLVLKDQAVDVLAKAIENVHAGEVWLEASMITSMLAEIAGKGSAEKIDPEQTGIARLTMREREVIVLVGEGLKNKQIAERLSISEATVSHHLTSIFDKLGVANRFDLVIYSFRHGLLQPPR